MAGQKGLAKPIPKSAAVTSKDKGKTAEEEAEETRLASRPASLPAVQEETPPLPEKMRRRIEMQRIRSRMSVDVQMRMEVDRFMRRNRAELEAKEATQRGRSQPPVLPSTVRDIVQAIEKAGRRPGDDLSPRLRKKAPPIGAFAKRQKVGVNRTVERLGGR